jgi:cellulose synthase/poly-beta-1,6-N-acetylglucosamine synthase-like glycosyltransferase
MTRFLVVVPTHRFTVAESTINELQASLTYPTKFHVLDGTPSKCHALNKALAELLDPAKHDIYVTIDDDILPGKNWQHFIACAFDRIPKLGACGVDYSGTEEGRTLMANAMTSPVQQVRDIQFRNATGLQNLAGGCFAIRPALAKEIGPYPFAGDGRQYHADEDGWRSHQVTRRGWKVGYVTNPNEPVRMITHQNTEQYTQTKTADLKNWALNPSWDSR